MSFDPVPSQSSVWQCRRMCLEGSWSSVCLAVLWDAFDGF